MTTSVGAPALAARDKQIDRLASERFDLLVVGGGITGAGTALDAASRGLRVALVERDDIAVGTSSRSGKLIHGGLRYLEHLRFGLVREALSERHRLLRLAPHLVHMEPFLFPVFGSLLAVPYYGAGLALYDLLGAARDGGRTRFLSARAARSRSPALRGEGLRGAFLYHDAVEDDARFALAVARTAGRQGAVVVTRCRAVEVIAASGRAAGVRVRDELAGRELDAAAGAVVDATGHWAMDGGGPFAGVGAPVMPSSGVHLVVPRERIPSELGLTIRVPGRIIFLIPWGRFWLLGTTDVPYAGSPDRPAPSADEIDYLLDHANHALGVRLGSEDIVAAFSGIRPLASDPTARSTVRASREHRILVRDDGLVSVRGGKYTTYRLMARDAVDAALGPAGRRAPSRTADLPLAGALSRPPLAALAVGLTERFALSAATAGHLIGRHGADAGELLELGSRHDLLRPLVGDLEYLEAEVAWAVQEELALSLDDVLSRRLRVAIETPDHGASVAARVAAIMAPALGWDAARQEAEVARYLAGAAREYGIPAAGPAHGRAPGGAQAGRPSAAGSSVPS